MPCKLPLDFDRIGTVLTEAVRDPTERPRSRHDGALFDTYSGKSVPGQLWNKYKNRRNEKGKVGLREKLECLLSRSTTSAQLEALSASLQWPDKRKSAYLKLKQKPTNQDEWLLDPDTGETHNGAHFPLFLVTDNACRRSAQACANRKEQWRQKHNGAAVAAWRAEAEIRDESRPRYVMSQADSATPARLLRCNSDCVLGQTPLPFLTMPSPVHQSDADNWQPKRWWDWSREWSEGGWRRGTSWWD